MSSKVVEIVSVGTEILLGNIVNTNAAFLAEECAKLGLSSYYQTVVGDNKERLKATILTALSRADIVLLSGGLGPTDDDLTKETACEVAKVECFMHEESRKRLIDYFNARGLTLTDNNYKQAMMPIGGIVLTNNNGTAPGCIIPVNDKYLILMPGPPVELKAMFTESVVPFLKGLSPEVIVSTTVKLVSVGESIAETMIKDLIDAQDNPTIATYAKSGEVHIRVTAKTADEKEAKRLIKPVIKELKNRFGNNIYTTLDDVTLEQAVVDLLKGAGLKVSFVESCTGGLVAARLVNVSGASEVFENSFVTYSDEAKHKLAQVKKSTLEKYTAVSAETAREMVKGSDAGVKADVIVGVTGYAGPSTSFDAPKGLVYVACNVCGDIQVKEFHFKGNRDKIRESACTQAFVLMREGLLKYLGQKTFS